jgi:ribosomal protein L1
MTEGSEFLTQQAEILPELYKDLFFKDKEGKIWMPNMVNQPDKGMVFAQGNNKDNWRWTGVKAVPVKEEEKKKYPKPGKKNEYYEFRMDMSTAKYFEEKDFMEALEYIGIFQS